LSEDKALPKIVCVDDEPSILHSLERLLKNSFQVLTAESPSAGLAQLRAHPDCAVVLSDYRMPESNGVEFLRQVRALYPHMSRAILSGQIDLHQVSDALNNHDIHKFFLKPWENDYLQVQMLEAVQMHRTLVEKAHFEHLSITDPVTQLTNHRHFQAQLRRQLEGCRADGAEMALVIFDVDHFKAFNDRFGHPEGDRLLYGVASQLKNQAGGDGLVSRYGGEEFTLILPLRGRGEAGMREALAYAERLRTHVERTPFSGLSSSLAYITLSAGLACFPRHGTEAGELIDAADRALYQAKRQGRNQIAVAAPK
jgi:diguanylate cyclase (GGDEF)-like protein